MTAGMKHVPSRRTSSSAHSDEGVQKTSGVTRRRASVCSWQLLAAGYLVQSTRDVIVECVRMLQGRG